jgi:hypothetical protein
MAFDSHRLLVEICSMVGPHRYLFVTEYINFHHQQDEEEFQSIFGSSHLFNSACTTAANRTRNTWTYPPTPPPPVPWRVTWDEGTAALPADGVYPSTFLREFADTDVIYKDICKDFHDGQFSLPVLRSWVMCRLHAEHVEHLGGGNGPWRSRSPYEQWSLLSGYVQHCTLGPVYMPRCWLVAKLGLDEVDLERLNRGLPCPQQGWCAVSGRHHCDNCTLLARGLGQAWHRSTYTGNYRRLFALWLSGHATGQHFSKGHTTPVHICGTACTHKRNAPLTYAAERLVKRRRMLEDVPPGFKRSYIRQVEYV